MDQKLISWARAVKARRWPTGRDGIASIPLPPLWLFSDRDRLADPAPVLRHLPKGLCGLVLRPGGVMSPATVRQALAICRERRFPVVVAGPSRARLLPRAVGRHFAARDPITRHKVGIVTAAAHNQRELMRAVRGRAHCVFLSPAFNTASHPGAGVLGPLRWSKLATRSPVPIIALGGVTGGNVSRLAVGACRGVGAIDALARGYVAQQPQCLQKTPSE